MTFSDSDAQRMLRIIDERIQKAVSQGAQFHWGVVEAVNTTTRKCTVSLFGDTASPGFTFFSQTPQVGNVVLVCVIPRSGDRWVVNTIGSALLTQGSIDVAGTTYPNLSSARLGQGQLELRHSTPYIDFANDNSTDFDARILYNPSTGFLQQSGSPLDMQTPGNRARNTAGATFNGAETTGMALEVYQPNSGADAYIAFHVAGDYAGLLGVSGAHNDLYWGGWSVGSKKKVWHAGNSTPLRFTSASTILVNQTSSASIGITAVATGLPAGAIASVEMRLSSATAHSNNHLAAVHDDGNDAGVVYNGSVAGYTNANTCLARLDGSGNLRWRFNWGNGTNTLVVQLRGYWYSW